jgi:hypothetical protein
MGGLASFQNSVPLVARGGPFALRWLCNMPGGYFGTCMRDVSRFASARMSCGSATACPVCPPWRHRGRPVQCPVQLMAIAEGLKQVLGAALTRSVNIGSSIVIRFL